LVRYRQPRDELDLRCAGAEDLATMTLVKVKFSSGQRD
jgi:hypothetical protein